MVAPAAREQGQSEKHEDADKPAHLGRIDDEQEKGSKRKQDECRSHDGADVAPIALRKRPHANGHSGRAIDQEEAHGGDFRLIDGADEGNVDQRRSEAGEAARGTGNGRNRSGYHKAPLGKNGGKGGGVRKVYHAGRFGVPIQSRQRHSMNLSVRILGLDPGLRRTGWGVIECAGNRLSYIACGAVETNDKDALALARMGHMPAR